MLLTIVRKGLVIIFVRKYINFFLDSELLNIVLCFTI